MKKNKKKSLFPKTMSKEAKQKQRAAIISYYLKKRQEEKLRDSNLKNKK